MSIAHFIIKVRKSMNLTKSIQLVFWLLFDNEVGAEKFAPLDFSKTDRNIELSGVGDNSTVLCYYYSTNINEIR
jgi:hypothetical protein